MPSNSWKNFNTLTFFVSGHLFEPVAKAQLKKITKLWQQEVRKAEEKAKRDAEAEEATKKKAEEAKKITIAEDASLPAAERTKISHLEALRGKRVKVNISLNIRQGVKDGLSGARWVF